MTLTYAVLTPMANAREKRAAEAWAGAGLPIQGLLKSYPLQEDSPAALALDEAVAGLGISLKTTDPEKATPTPEQVKVWEGAKGSVSEYLNQLEKPELGANPPSEALAAYLAQVAPALADIRARLKAGDIRWRLDTDKGFAMEIPNLLGHLNLTRLLLADALARHADSKDPVAVEDVEAVWNLSAPLESRPELISQLVCIAMRKLAVVTLRNLDGVPLEWVDRLKAWDPEAGLLRAYSTEAAMMGTVADAPSFGAVMGEAPVGLGSKIGTFLAKPYIRLCLADTQIHLLRQVEAVRDLGPCADDEALLKQNPEGVTSVPAWNIIGRIALPSLIGGAWGRVKHLRIQAELTEKVITIKASRDATGAWPAEVPGIEASFCAKERWTYAVAPDGSMSLAFSGPAPSREIARALFPQEYREGPGKAKGR